MKKSLRNIIAIFSIAVLLSSSLTSCYTLTHKVGNGASGNNVQQDRQWYILYGLVPLNNVDSQAMAGNSKDYTVSTQMSPVDIIISAFLGFVTVASRTVEVRK